VAELRITERREGPAGQRRVYVTWQDGATRRHAEATLGPISDAGDGERIRWYLEEYAEFPADPAPVLAAAAEAQLARVGAELFARVFSSGPAAAGIWDRAREQLDPMSGLF
jgi:hypothetical protein